MISSFIIMFRETLEAALIVGILLAYLAKAGKTRYNRVIYLGTTAGIAASIIIAYAFITFSEGFQGRAEQIFEGIVMLAGSVLLTTMILWMIRQRHSIDKIEKGAELYLSRGKILSLGILVGISVLREGVESVIFLSALNFSSGSSMTGAALGVLGAVILGFFIFTGGKKLNIGIFFLVTNILLILFAAGLITASIHEFQKAALLPVIIENLWNINHVINEKSLLGSIFRGLFGYNGNPSLIEVFVYISYIFLAALLWKKKEN